MPFSTGLLLGKINKGGRYVGQGMSATSIYGVGDRVCGEAIRSSH
jgi:hypothetical protein